MRWIYKRVLLVSVAVLFVACHGVAAASAKVIKGGDNYKILAENKIDKKNRRRGMLVVVIEPTGGWKMEREKGPAGFVIEPPEAVALAKKSWKKTDAKWEGNARIRFEVPYELTAAGPATLKMKFRFVLCTDKLCQMKRFELDYPLAR